MEREIERERDQRGEVKNGGKTAPISLQRVSHLPHFLIVLLPLNNPSENCKQNQAKQPNPQHK
jgi:hypothetical protein